MAEGPGASYGLSFLTGSWWRYFATGMSTGTVWEAMDCWSKEKDGVDLGLAYGTGSGFVLRYIRDRATRMTLQISTSITPTWSNWLGVSLFYGDTNPITAVAAAAGEVQQMAKLPAICNSQPPASTTVS
jgi:hypothetical protein